MSIYLSSGRPPCVPGHPTPDRQPVRASGGGAPAPRKPPLQEHVDMYLPPAKCRHPEEQRGQGGAAAIMTLHLQHQCWERLQRSISGTVNQLSPTAIKSLVHALFSEANMVRGRRLLARSILRAS